MVTSQAIADAVREAIVLAATRLRPDVLAVLKVAATQERSERARAVLGQLLDNARIAEADSVPLCQDTGYVWVLLEVGVHECLSGDVQAAVDAAVAEAYSTARLRASIALDALLDRTNTGDNTPAFVDISFREGSGVTVNVMLKGGGSDNASVVRMLAPGEGEEGVRRLVLDVVTHSAAGACPPLIVGVGVGATFDKVGGLAKKALLREVGTVHPDPRAAELERRLLADINATGIGPAGLGGDTTALAVHVATAACHIAALPVAVNMGCSAVRTARVEVA